MKYLRVTFTNNLKDEAEYICFNAKSIQMGYYQAGGYLILPYILKKNDLSVNFPDLKFSSNFWKLITKCKNKDFGKEFPAEAVTEVKKQLSKIRGVSQKAIKNRATEWKRIEKKLFSAVNNFLELGSIISKISEIKILVTNYGTLGSFNYQKIGKKLQIYLTLRSDYPTESIIRTLLLAFYALSGRENIEIGEAGWSDRQSTVDFLVNQTVFRKLYKEQKPVLITQKDIQASNSYLAKLGFPTQPIIIESQGKVFVSGKVFDNLLTMQEKVALTLLLQNQGQIVSFDTLGDVIWQENSDEKFSLYALAKIIENLRRKLREFGINRNLILTLRKQGYLLTN